MTKVLHHAPAQSLGPSRHKITSLAGSSDVVPPEKEQNQLDTINDIRSKNLYIQSFPFSLFPDDALKHTLARDEFKSDFHL